MAAAAAARGGMSMSHPPPPEAEAGMQRVRRKKDFTLMERVEGRLVNVLQGLELHTGVFSPAEQQRIVECMHDLQDKGRRGLLRGERTYSEPRKWMRGKGRATIQFGCCYNYATDRDGNPPGIIRGQEAATLPPPLKSMLRRLVAWRVLPPDRVPDSCIVNVYDIGDCIPPHVDHRDFARPFCTVSFLAECAILFGRADHPPASSPARPPSGCSPATAPTSPSTASPPSTPRGSPSRSARWTRPRSRSASGPIRTCTTSSHSLSLSLSARW